jgi:hypothetical protein
MEAIMLDTDTQKVFDEIVAKDPVTLTPDEVGFLWARQSYLSEEQLEKFEAVLQPPMRVSEVEAVEKLDRKELMRKAKEMGLKPKPTMKAPQVKALIDDAVFEQEVADEERLENEARVAEAEAKAAEEEKAKTGHKGNFDSIPTGTVDLTLEN